jgi:hypothetical protein
MLLNAEVKPAVATGKVVASGFGIGNADVILTYLTKTIYSNPIRAICQEIMSNGRDAHRETGNMDRPVVVKIPNTLSPTWECQDFGPGITPERMVKVFTQYGNSTKRGDNLQTGGFGIGCKTPFSYSDTFTIRTVSNEDGKHVLRLYAAIKEGDTTPRLMEIGEPQEVQEPTGTTISLPVKPDDFRDFCIHTFKVTQFWDVRPEIRGTNDYGQWETYNWQFQGTNWKIGEGKGYYAESYVCVDGIPYSLKKEEFRNLPNNLSNLTDHNLVMFFGVGQLSLSLNREQLQYDDRTKKAITARLEEIQDFLETEVETAIKGASNFWEANIVYNKMNAVFRYNRLTNNVLWNTLKVDGRPLENNNGIEIRSFFMRNGKLRSDREYDIVPNETDKYLFNDIPGERSIVRRIKALQAQFPHAKNIYVITPGLDASQFVKWQAENHWQEIQAAFTLLSTINPIKIVRAPKGTAARVSDIQSIQHGCHYFSNESNFDAVNGSGVYVETFRNKVVCGMGVHTIRELYECGILDKTVKVYGVPSRFVAKLGKGWVPLKDHANAAYHAYVASIPHVIASLSNITNEEGSIFSEISSHITDYIENNNAKLFQGKLVNWYKQSETVRNQPDPFTTPEAKKLQNMARLTGNNVDSHKGTATLSSMKVEQHYIDVLRHLIPASWNMPNDEKAKTLLLETVNFILKKIG